MQSNDIDSIWKIFIERNNISERKKPYRTKNVQIIADKREHIIDLHGLSEEMAYDALDSFLHLAHKKGLSKLIVITGKGFGYVKGIEATYGILRRVFPYWMLYSNLSVLIKSFTLSLPSDGGDGAFYVYI